MPVVINSTENTNTFMMNATFTGDKTETLTIKNIAQLICSMTSYSTDVLETNMFEVIEMGKISCRNFLSFDFCI